MRRLLVCTLTLLLSHTALAQMLTERPVSHNPVSPSDMTRRLETSAIRTRKSAPQGAARGSSVDFVWPASPEEYRALAKHVLVLVSVVTQDPAELPLRRVYVVDAAGKQTELTRLSSQRIGVRKDSVTSSVLGSGVMDAEPELVRVLVYVNQVSTKPGVDPQIFQNRVAMTMRKDGDRWLVSNVNSY